MKITFVLDEFSLTGGNRVIAIYAKKLQERGHEVIAVARPPHMPTLREQVRSLVKGEGWIRVLREPPSHFDQGTVPRHVIERRRDLEEADVPDADVVVATWWETAHWVAKFSPAKGAKVHFIQHHEVFDYLPAESAATYFLPFHKIVIAQWLREVMHSQYGDSNVSCVPNGVDTKQFYAPPRRKQPIPTIGMVYSTTPWKGTDTMLEAYKIAANEVPGLRLLMFGESRPPANQMSSVNMTFAYKPAQSELRHHYASCDAWLFGSRTEGFGLPILEAMACRTPVIGTPAGIAPELLSDGAGLLVKPEDPVDMARAIVQICRLSEIEWRALSDTAFDRVKKYTWDDAVDRFEAALKQAVVSQTVPHQSLPLNASEQSSNGIERVDEAGNSKPQELGSHQLVGDK